MALVFPFIIKNHNGEKIITPQDMLSDTLPDMDTLLDVSSPLESIKNKVREVKNTFGEEEFFPSQTGEKTSSKNGLLIYRWRDDEGRWQFSDTINPEGEYEAIVVEMAVQTSGLQVSSEVGARANDNSVQLEGLESILSNLNKLPLPLTISSEDLQTTIEEAGGLQAFIDQYGDYLDSGDG